MLKPIMHQVEAEFDGHRLYAAGAGRGERVRVAVLDANYDREFDPHKDEVIFRKPAGGSVTREDLEAFSAHGSLSGLDLDGLHRAGACFARNEQGKKPWLALNPGWFSRAWSRLAGNPVRDWFSLDDKIASGRDAYRQYRASVDAKGEALSEQYVFDPHLFKGYMESYQNQRMLKTVVAVAGWGMFFAALAGHSVGWLGPAGMVGVIVGSCAAVSAMNRPRIPDAFRPRLEGFSAWEHQGPEGLRIASYEETGDQAALQAEEQAGLARLSEYLGPRNQVLAMAAALAPAAVPVQDRNGYMVIGGVRIRKQRLLEVEPEKKRG
ncbi:MAG: hypothetical protein AB1758_34100 [Candidatus Eremiobacterota bacterium]